MNAPYAIDGVIILSAHCTCSLAPVAFLAGGDYDGDKANLNDHAPIVENLMESPYSADLDGDGDDGDRWPKTATMSRRRPCPEDSGG